MSCRTKKPKCNCGDRKQQARCTYYEGYLPEDSELEQGCTTIEETTEELYKNSEKVNKFLDLEGFKDTCIKYSEHKEGKDITLKEVLKAISDIVCNDKNNKDNPNVTSDNSLSLSGIDLKCLSTDCRKTVSNPTELFQIIIDNICDLKSRTNE